ncbi:MAG: hypothetical protein IJ484_03740 [Oscillospiraceae bacterium]|nr:hypothetical protein [Oscillospiraceae bacterium]
MQFGVLSIVPPLVTIVLALVLKNVFISLLIGIFLACLILCGGNPFVALNDTFYGVVDTFASSGNTIVLLSMLFIGALIHMIEVSGGIEGFVDIMVKKRGIIKSKKAAALFTWLLGIFVFTSGSLSCMVTGSVSRPLNDSMKVSHEKAAFLVHTTSTPWCVLFPLSGWLASMTGYLTSGGVAEDAAISTLIASIPLNFYCIIAVVFALLSCLLPLDFGPMKKAELRVDTTGELDDPTRPVSGGAAVSSAPASGMKPRAANMLVPMGVMIGTILAVLTVTGNGNPTAGSGMQALLWGCVISLFTIAIMCAVEGLYKLDDLIGEIMKGMGSMLPIFFVLLLGFTMGTLVKSLDTGNYLSSIFMQFLSPALLPLLTFIIAMLLSFSTGTSMGTMAIMATIALPMAINMGVSVPLVAGAMFGGSIFGDHSSPISDTTIMSCATTGCDIIAHVRTQMPYVACFAGVSMVLYVIMGFVM